MGTGIHPDCVIPVLTILLRIAGIGLILLALVHVPIGRKLRWKDDCKKLTTTNAEVFRVHTLFICVVLVMMALPCLCEPDIFLIQSRAGTWLAWSFSAFWAIRLYCQWFVYSADLWRGKRGETAIHWIFTVIWLSLTLVFGLCGMVQSGLFAR
jgi:hypothetical protein